MHQNINATHLIITRSRLLMLRMGSENPVQRPCVEVCVALAVHFGQV
jgi:hypothetical protein